MVGTAILSPTDATSEEAVAGSTHGVVVERTEAPRDAAVNCCLAFLGS